MRCCIHRSRGLCRSVRRLCRSVLVSNSCPLTRSRHVNESPTDGVTLSVESPLATARVLLMRRRIGWMIGVALAYWVMWSKGGYDTVIEALGVALTGGVIGLSLACASEQSRSIVDARLKMAYWPLALVLFIVYPTMDVWSENKQLGIGWLRKPFSIAAGVGLIFGISHWLVVSRKLPRPTHDS